MFDMYHLDAFLLGVASTLFLQALVVFGTMAWAVKTTKISDGESE